MKARTDWTRVDGVLLLDKPPGMSSNAALQSARRIFRAAKGGHTGTLDPLATGLLPLCFGEATKFAQLLLDADKEYLALVRLGISTDTGDAEGRPGPAREVDCGLPEVERVLRRFRGAIRQTPPMHSALKHHGRPLYELARRGIEIERKGRSVTVHELEVTEFRDALLGLRVQCSKGTYIRVLAADIGDALGCGGHLASLRRTRVGSLRVEDAHTLESLATLAEAQRAALLLPPDSLLTELPQFFLDEIETARFANGQAVSARPGMRHDAMARVYGTSGFLGVGRWHGPDIIRPLRLMARSPEAASCDHGHPEA